MITAQVPKDNVNAPPPTPPSDYDGGRHPPPNGHHHHNKAALCDVARQFFHEMKRKSIPDFSSRVAQLVAELVKNIQAQMDQNAASPIDGEEEQQGFSWDHALALQIDELMHRGPPELDVCVSWYMLVHAVRAMSEDDSCEDDGSDDGDDLSIHVSHQPRLVGSPVPLDRLQVPCCPGPSSCPSITSCDAYRALSKALIRANPMLAFDDLPLTFLAQPCKNPNSHRLGKAKRDLPAFHIAMAEGAHDLVKFMMDECLNFVSNDTKLSKPSLKLLKRGSDPRRYLVNVMNKKHFNFTALEHAVNNYREIGDKKQLDVLEMLLGFDDLDGAADRLADENILEHAVRQTFLAFGTAEGDFGRFSEDGIGNTPEHPTCRDNQSLRVVKVILQYRRDMKTKDAILHVLGWGLARELGRAQLVEIFTIGAEDQVDGDVVGLIMKHNLVDVWRLDPIQRAVARLLRHDQTAKNVFCAALTLTKGSHFVQSIAPQVVRVLDFDIMSDMVKRGHLDAWELPPIQARWSEISKEEQQRCMLHVAVQYQQIEFVRHFLRQDPAWVTKAIPVQDVPDKAVYALWHHNFVVGQQGTYEPRVPPPNSQPSWNMRGQPIGAKTTSNSAVTRPGAQRVEKAHEPMAQADDAGPEGSPKLDARAEIRKLLVHATIQQAKDMKTIARIFRESDEPAGQICFDLSRFASRLYSVDEFLHSLVAVKGRGSERHLKFEEVLRYADFPPLGPDAWDKGPEWHLHVHDEVFRALNWLRDRRVRKIMKLRVLDRMHDPHDEVEIAKVVGEFEVSVLDWRHLDMAISCFSLATKQRLTELHLYSSGKMAVVDHWLGENGIKSLTNLKLVRIHLIQDLMTSERSSSLKARISEALRALRAERKGFKSTIVAQSWNSLPPNDGKDLSEIAERAVPDLLRYINNYRNKVLSCLQTNTPVRPTRVAIIDNGILNIPPFRTSQNHEGLWPRIKDGQSFVDDASRLGSWLFASDPHGTQMANLMCAIDPYCDLYVAKIVEGREGILPDNVAEAIDWANSRKVDIISMSFAIPENGSNEEYTKELRMAVDRANQNGIVLFCSHHDEGWNVRKSWPAECDGTKVIVACNEYGNFANRHVGEYNYKIHGMDISAGAVPYLESSESISGSSVATAMVAGLSSLMLSCHRLQFPGVKFNGKGDEYISKRDFIEQMLRRLSDPAGSDGEGPLYVQLRKFEQFACNKDGNEVYPWLRA
ncbi:subtilase family protein [Hirsutella rhossiliensis]|uniref:Subtilase family domain-containing protein n=1 Tax=Hirsutella rhossiliensis TaxID=111463 RepID=A0A9P8N1S5_9HYPO|nr:subtilase family domain-containing protein [Hirsutella rhossiliensis]KAH0963132.1 subtilase family domain-containing protein [Hirsutella rhossiliensis]